MAGVAGSLLVASPMLEDPNFARTIILVLEHTDEGALGLVLNRPSQTEVGEALPRWASLAGEPPLVFVGGPVEPQAAICLGLAVPGEHPDGWRPISRGLGVVDLEADPDLMRGAVRGVRVFAGYAGWGAGQLEGELSVGGWFVVRSEPTDPLTPTPDDLWRLVLRRQRGPLALLSTYPPDPRLN